MNSLKFSDTQEYVELPKGNKVLHNKSAYRIKDKANESKCYKTRLFVKGFKQKYGINYTNVFTPVVRLTTIRLVFIIVVVENLLREQLDVKTAFVVILRKNIYMNQLKGYLEEMYGLQQDLRQRYKKLDGCMRLTVWSNADQCCYIKRFGNN